MLFKEFGGVDAFPICLATKDVDEIVATVKAIAPGLRRDQPRGHLRAALLRDRGSAARGARHPGLPRRPARHGDRRARRAHNAVEVVGKRLEDLRVVVTGVGAAGVAVTKILLAAGVPRLVGCDRQGVVHAGRPGPHAGEGGVRGDRRTRAGCSGTADEALAGADVFIGLSQPARSRSTGIRSMATARSSSRWPTRPRGAAGGDPGRASP